jgi:pimeloyl-ACP methyl ester carboxylesterase
VIREHDVPAPGGRSLHVLEAGAAGGVPVFFHNGTPGAAGLHESWIEDAEHRGIRLLSYDRPGYGGSPPARGRTVADAAADTASVADALGIDRFSVWGVSGGGPHTLACAALLGERVAAAALLASAAPYPAEGLDWLEGMGEGNRVEFAAALEGREALEPLLDEIRTSILAADAEGLAAELDTLLSPADREVLTGELAQYMVVVMKRALVNGTAGWVDENLAFTRAWGFDIEGIAVPTLLMHGATDRFVPISHGQWLAERIPGVEARLLPDDGHLTLVARRVPEVHAWLLERAYS